jgi:predicted O-methyltransferase YrrM
MLSTNSTLIDFAAGLVGVNETEIEKFTDEIRSNQVFHDALKAKQKEHGEKRTPQASVNDEVGTILYTICRVLRPDNVVETGVASGVSTSYFLCALEQNRKGRLHSIDFSTWEPETGWIIPDYLKHRWELSIGRSSEHLPQLLDRLGEIQVFFHDSEHTYQNMIWEYNLAWTALKPGGVLLSHNIDFTKAFGDFYSKIESRSRVFQNLGGIFKPEA